MRALIRRVSSARVEAEGHQTRAIAKGLLVYLGVHREDSGEDVEWMVSKILGLRIFACSQGKMNLPIGREQGILAISQFTLLGNCRKGFRPSFNDAADPERGRSLYDEFLALAAEKFEGRLQSGFFGSDMQITAVDDGPVSIWLDSLNRKY